jgi:tetratricopeptide (TPR) repeat protein
MAMPIRNRKHDFMLFYCFLASALFIVFFAYKTRYFIPTISVATVFAAHGLVKLVSLLGRCNRSAIQPLIALLTVSALSMLNPLGIYRQSYAETLFAIGDNLRRSHHPGEAIEYLLAASALKPSDISICTELGLAYLYNGEIDRSLNVLRQTWQQDTNYPPLLDSYRYVADLAAGTGNGGFFQGESDSLAAGYFSEFGQKMNMDLTQHLMKLLHQNQRQESGQGDACGTHP